MIQITPYIQKLDRLREYINLMIDGKGGFCWVNIDAIPQMNPEQFFRLYAETGMIFFDGNPPPPPTKKLSFEEWLQLKTSETLNQ